MKRFFRLSAALAALALLSGCASLLHPRQVEDLQLIQTIGFDGGIGDMTVSVSSGEASEDAVSAQLAASAGLFAAGRAVLCAHPVRRRGRGLCARRHYAHSRLL